jgi:hypothetical protein
MSFSRKLKKFVGYVVYVGYRLDAPGSYNPGAVGQ